MVLVGVGMESGGMATAKRPEVGLGMPGAPWTQRRIAFHASSTYSSAPAMEPLNDPVIGNGGRVGAGAIAGAGSAAGGSHSANKLTKQNPQNAQRLPSSMPLQWPTAQKIGAGLSNLGNTCFLNSVLQCLTYTPPLAGYLQSGQHKMSCRVAGFCAFCALQEHVSQALASSGRVVAPNKLAKNLRSISRSFRMCRQEDAHEYMRYLLEALHKCCIPPELATSSSSKPSQDKSQDKSLVYKIFGGRLRSQVKCSVCSHCSNTYDPFLDLSLDIVRADSLTKALTRFTAVDTLDGENKYRCAHCKKKVRAQKQFTIETVPNILTIQFKRFSSTVGGKIDKKVDFGTTLDMKPFCSSQESSLKYRLYGVLVHSGWSTHSGHYYCFVRTSSDIWHVLDDSRVRQVSERTVLEQKAYMLFYVREARKEAIPPGQVVPKAVPSSAPVPAVISFPKETKSIPSPSNGPSVLPKNNTVVASFNGPGHMAEVAPMQDVSNTIPAVAVEPAPSAAEGSTVKLEPLSCEPSAPEPCGETKDGGGKVPQVETCCTTSGCEAEADWDEHYKSGMNLAMISSQNMLKLLRAMPRTRRYFMARAMQRANKGLPAHVGTPEPATSLAKKEAKRRLSTNGEVSGNKRLQKDSSDRGSSVSLVTSDVPYEKDDHSNPLHYRERIDGEIACSLQENDAPAEVREECTMANALSDSVDKLDVEKGSMNIVVENGGGANLHTYTVDYQVLEPVERREGHQSGAELRSDRSDEISCQPMTVENGGPREHSLGNGTNDENATKSTNGSANRVYQDNLYGVGVPRWNEDDIGVKQVDRFLRETQKASTLKQQDSWDAEYDRGRSKKVRSKAVQDSDKSEMTNGLGNGSFKSENLFQAFGSSKPGNWIGNGKRVGNANANGNGIANGHGSGNGSRAGKYVGSVGSPTAKRRVD